MHGKIGFLLVILTLGSVFASGCIGGSPNPGKTTTSSTSGIDFKAYPVGGVLSDWSKLFNESVIYVSPGYENLVRHYFPGAHIMPLSKYRGGIAVMSPQDARETLAGKPALITRRDYFGYVLYLMGIHYVGADKGLMVAYKSTEGDRLILTGTGMAGVGAALQYAVAVKDGKIKVNEAYVIHGNNFEAVGIKEIGDNNWDGIPEAGELVTIHQFRYGEPFQFYWRIVNGENVTVDGAFIRLVNGSTVYVRALGFNITVNVLNPRGVNLTYVVENVNPEFMNLPEGAKVNGTSVVLKTSAQTFSLTPKDVENYTVLAFGDHRPPSGDKPPEVFLKIRDRVNNESGAFIIDGGDLVYSGDIDQWVDLMKAWKWNKPVFVASGNHEYQGDGVDIYTHLFGPTNYAFSLGHYRYIFANDVEDNYNLPSRTIAWMKRQFELAKEHGQRPVLVMHVPPIDPRPNGHHSLGEESAKQVLELMKEYNAFGIFSHIHMYWYGTYDGVPILITGGGGAPLYAPHDKGGFYHYVILSMGLEGIGVKPVEVTP